MDEPKLFISYSWTTPEHVEFVLGLATRLCESGVDVILDKWHLREGDDADAFMEKMVADEAIKKVLMVVDRAYAEKSNKRQRGVGTEAQIISREVYQQQSQQKFVALSVENNDDGQPYRPAYYASRIYIDLTDRGRYEEKVEELLRWIFNKPTHVKPPLGKMPSYLESTSTPRSPTSSRLQKTIDAIKTGKTEAIALLIDFFDEYLKALDTLEITSTTGELDDTVVANIESALPLQRDCISVVQAISRYMPDNSYTEQLHYLLEGALARYRSLRDKPNLPTRDNFIFLGHELALATLASLIGAGRFHSAHKLIESRYYFKPERTRSGNQTVSIFEFREYLRILDVRKNRLKLNRTSLFADMLKQRAENSSPDFNLVMQADLVLFLYSRIHSNDVYNWWWPETLIYANMHAPMEIFARSESISYFENLKILLHIASVEEFKESISAISSDPQNLPNWNFQRLHLRTILNIEKLASRR